MNMAEIKRANKDAVPWGSPPAPITALDAQDLAFLAWARNVTLDEIEAR